MKKKFIKNLHWIIVAFVAWGLFGDYQSSEEQKENLRAQLSSLKSQERKLKKEISVAKKFMSNLEAAKTRVKEVSEQIETVKRQLPDNIQDTEVLGFFYDEANALNIKEITQQALNEDNRGFYFAKQYNVNAKGTYLQFLVFLERLGLNDKIFNIFQLNMKRAEDKRRGRFQIINFQAVLETFRFNPAGTIEVDSPKKIDNKKAPANRPRPRRAKRRRT